MVEQHRRTAGEEAGLRGAVTAFQGTLQKRAQPLGPSASHGLIWIKSEELLQWVLFIVLQVLALRAIRVWVELVVVTAVVVLAIKQVARCHGTRRAKTRKNYYVRYLPCRFTGLT